MYEVVMPQLGETVADGTVTKWCKSVGQAVAKGEALFEVSTDKVETEVPSPVDGVLDAIVVQEGETVDVGAVLATISQGGSDERAAASADDRQPSGPSATPPAAEGRDPAARRQLSPAVRRLLEENKLDASEVTGTGPNGRITRADVLSFVALGGAAPKGGRVSALSPVVRRLIEQSGIDPASLRGSGRDGRITRTDVEAAIAERQTPVDAGDEAIPFSRIRRLTADRMIHSKATSAHTLMVKEIDYERVEAVRRAFGASFKEREGFSLTYLPFNAVAVTEALSDFPHLNASVGSDELVVHKTINLGIAVDVQDRGLVVPVVRGAASLSLIDVARRIRELTLRARGKHLSADDLSGGTFTITNPGPLGTLMTGAIINQPEVAILSTDAVSRKPVVVSGPMGEETLAVHSVGLIALTFDHRVIDGAYAARFLSRVEEVLNTRGWTEELQRASR